MFSVCALYRDICRGSKCSMNSVLSEDWAVKFPTAVNQILRILWTLFPPTSRISRFWSTLHIVMVPVSTSVPRTCTICCAVLQKSWGNLHSQLLNQKCPVQSWLSRCSRKSVKKCTASNSLLLCSLETLRLFSGWLPRTTLQIVLSSMVPELWRLLHWQTQITGSGVLTLSTLLIYSPDLVQLWNRSILTSGLAGVFSPNLNILGLSRNVCPSCRSLHRSQWLNMLLLNLSTLSPISSLIFSSTPAAFPRWLQPCPSPSRPAETSNGTLILLKLGPASDPPSYPASNLALSRSMPRTSLSTL